MMFRAARSLVKRAFRAAGLEVRRRSRSTAEPESPRIFDDPLDALYYQQGGKPAAFACPLRHTRSRLGFCYGGDGWHPYVETLREYEAGACTSYDDSILRAYHETHQPASAAEALVGFDHAPRAFRDLPGHLCYLSPWTSNTAEEIDGKVRSWVIGRNREHGHPCWDLASDGYSLHGPVSRRKGRTEYQRLVSLYETIKSEGYDRSHGDVQFLILQRGQRYQFLQWGAGSHRTAVMAALGRETIPGVFRRPRRIIDVEHVDHWPQVRDGVWDRETARAYVEHLFRFDTRAWARTKNLVLDARATA